MKCMRQSRRAFTLIELLIVLAIISVLATVVMVGGEQARSKARDAQRISDLSQIQVALEAYFEASPMSAHTYPATLAPLAADPTKYLPAIPTDPSTHADYSYLPGVNVDNEGIKSYCLGTTLENTHHQAIASSDPCSTSDLTNNYKVSR